MNKPWFDQYDPWVPHEIDADAYANVVDMLLEAGERFKEISEAHSTLSDTD
jgi:hypothetical protein